MIPVGAVQAIKLVVGLLVESNYEVLEKMTQGRHLTAEEMARAVTEYGRTLVLPPDEAYEDIDAIDSTVDGKHTHAVDFPLWTKEEGRSDLEVELTLVEVMDRIYAPEIDNIRVP